MQLRATLEPFSHIVFYAVDNKFSLLHAASTSTCILRILSGAPLMAPLL
jgi:hypothetical protein